MMDKTTGLAAVAAAVDQPNMVTRADHDAALIATHAAGVKEGVQAGGEAERARCKGILGAKEAKGRDDLAAHLAFDTAMTVEAAVAVLAKSPAKAEAPAA